MAIFSVFFIVLTYWQVRGFEDTVRSLAIPSQAFCKSLLDFSSPHLVFYQAIACGIEIKDSSVYDILRTVSLWHLIIVSAGHFKFLQWLLKKFKIKSPFFASAILLCFCFWTGAQPPVVRAYSEQIMNKASIRMKLWIPQTHKLLFSSSFLLLLFPSWSLSWSFLLSWLCGGLMLLLSKQTYLMQCIGLAAGVFPVMILFSQPHPLGFLFNFILGPILSFVLFPMSLLMMIFPAIHLLVDPFLDGLLLALTKIAGSSNTNNFVHYPTPWQLQCCWLYVLGLQIFMMIQERKNARAR